MSILVCDHHTMFVHALVEALEANGHVVAAATTEPSVVPDLVDHHAPTVLLIGVQFPHTNGLDVVREVRRRGTDTIVVLLTGSTSTEVRRAFDTKLADALVSKCSGIAGLETALRAVLRGERTVVGWGPTPRSRRRTPLDGLTPRERQVLALLAIGSSTTEIACRMEVSVNTVRTHVRSILLKLGVHHRTMAIQVALQFERTGVLEAGGVGGRSTRFVS